MRDIFENYSRHVLVKFIKNGYRRVEFRALLIGLKDYDKDGSLVKENDEKSFV